MDPEGILVADRSERAKLRLNGEQDAWFLHQVLTQSIEDMTTGEAREAGLLTVHGRMVGYGEFVRYPDGFLAHFEPELRDTFADALRRYVFATRVEIADVTDDYGLVLTAGTGSMAVARGLSEVAVAHPTWGLGIEAALVWCSPPETADLIERLQDRGAALVGEQELEAIRVARGVPRWGRDMDPKTLVMEAGIEERAIDFDKGCYPGQEVVAKIHFRGKVNRRLRRLVLEGDAEAGSELMLDGDVVGRLTSVADGHALAMLKHIVEPGATLTTEGATATVER